MVYFYLLDVGMGDCTLITSPDDKVILIDFGSTKSRAVTVKPTVEFIKDVLGPRKTIDLLLFTHGDIDHYNQIPKLEADIPGLRYGEIYYGGALADYNGKIFKFGTDFLAKKGAKPILPHYSNMTQTPNWNFGELKLWIMGANYPYPAYEETNPKSAMIWAEYKTNIFILPGDATEYTEGQVMEKAKKAGVGLKANFLKLAHHGSETSSCNDWVDATRPEVITISADNNPGYKLPRQSIVEKYDPFLHSNGTWQGTYVAYNGESMFPKFERFTTKKYTLANLENIEAGVDWVVEFRDNGSWEFHHY
jgi:competence protein ComEC